MALTPSVLLLSNRRDVSLDWIVRGLRERQTPYLRINSDRLTDEAWSISPGDDWIVRRKGEVYSLRDVQAILLRRPEPTRVSGVVRAERLLVRNQWRALLDGLASLPRATWINDQWANARAETKLIQLECARKVGLRVPETLVTNSKSDALAFVRSQGGTVIAKGLDAPLIPSRLKPRFTFSNLVDSNEIEKMMDVELAPLVLQQPILPKVDTRATVVGGRVLAAETKTTSVDWRLDREAKFEPAELSADTVAAIRQLMGDLGLRFAGIDLAIGADGTPWFLELNPSGEWGWLQASGLPIADAIVDELVTGATQ